MGVYIFTLAQRKFTTLSQPKNNVVTTLSQRKIVCWVCMYVCMYVGPMYVCVYAYVYVSVVVCVCLWLLHIVILQY